MKVTVDGILHPVSDPKKILVITRKWEPFQGHYALPGGFVDEDEAVEDALVREMKEEVQLDVTIEAILGVFSEKGRDPRGHVVTVVFICSFEGEFAAADDAASVKLVPISDLLEAEVAFDHQKIISHYNDMLISESRETFWSKK